LFYADLWYNRARRRNERPNGKMAGYISCSYLKFQTPISPKCGLFLLNRFTIDDLAKVGIGVGFSNLDRDYDSDTDADF
ncbi:MAG: hypothetical protein ABSC60_17510, partial [Acidobacteriota bacterium]